MIVFRKGKIREKKRRPESILVFGFLLLILLGTVLLALPVSARNGKSIGLFDSLFTATSAVCVTGLVAVDTGTVFSFFGQAVLLVLIQVGGLGFMVFATMIMVMLGRRISLKGRMLIRESMNGASLSDLSVLTKLYLLLALGIEAVGVPADLRTYIGQSVRETREIAARCKDFLFGLFEPGPAISGEPIDLTGSGSVTDDGKGNW